MKDFNNKVVVITGASSGIGKATAIEFAKAGARVCLTARRKDKLEAVTNEIKSIGGNAYYKVTDVSKEEDCKSLINSVIKEQGGIDILINNAGISMRSLFKDVELKVLKRLMDVNFWGAVYCTKYALPYLLKSKGVVVGVSSVAGFHGLPARTGYSASKFALHGFLETLRIENLKKGLHVMVIAPGFTASEVREHALVEDGSEQGKTPRKEEKMMSAEKVARILLRSIKRKKRNKILTLSGQLTALLQRIVPEQVDYIYYKLMAKEPNSPLNKDLSENN